jgi:hypothetical protein
MQYLKRVHLYTNKRNSRFNNSSETWQRNKFHYTATSDIPLLSVLVLNIQHMWFVIVDANKSYNDGILRLTYKDKLT